jgi:hypothetical protein
MEKSLTGKNYVLPFSGSLEEFFPIDCIEAIVLNFYRGLELRPTMRHLSILYILQLTVRPLVREALHEPDRLYFFTVVVELRDIEEIDCRMLLVQPTGGKTKVGDSRFQFINAQGHVRLRSAAYNKTRGAKESGIATQHQSQKRAYPQGNSTLNDNLHFLSAPGTKQINQST